MLAKSLDINQITLQNRPKNSFESVRLTMGILPLYSQSFSSDDPIIVIKLGQYDTDRIKAFIDLATEPSNTFISITSETIKDMNNNEVVAIPADNAHIVQVLYEDLVPPRLLSFVLDLNKGLVMLTFSETVETGSLQVDEISFHSSRDMNAVIWTLTNLTEANLAVGIHDFSGGSEALMK